MKTRTSFAIVAAIAGAASAPAMANTINFDEFAADNVKGVPLTNEYAGMGVNFVTTDDGVIWDGVSGGDPGGWGLDGSNGPQFVVFQGLSSMTILFDVPVTNASIDFTYLFGPGGGSLSSTSFLRGEGLSASLRNAGSSQNWITASFSQQLDEIRLEFIFSSDQTGFALDNLNWTPVPAPGAAAVFAIAGMTGLRRRR